MLIIPNFVYIGCKGHGEDSARRPVKVCSRIEGWQGVGFSYQHVQACISHTQNLGNSPPDANSQTRQRHMDGKLRCRIVKFVRVYPGVVARNECQHTFGVGLALE